ncbi:MAG: NAD(P)/FAD-dependent oxidoreductase [Thermoplasmata archaeon]|nr:NAD(P)/FAD-dependent oxidoreductase [Thermoplasmata archaeon]
MHIMIVGAGAAGMSALETIRKNDEKVKVTVVSESEPYSPFALAEFITGAVDMKKIKRFGKKIFSELDARFVNERVEKVDIRNNQLIMGNGPKLKYNKLLLAQGSTPIEPRIKGIDKIGVFYFLTLKAAQKLKKRISDGKVKSIVIIGAGITGLELAESLSEIGVNVTVVEMLGSVLPKVVDADIARKLEKNMRSRGIRLLLNEKVTEILGNEKVTSVKTNKRSIKADTVIMTLGVEPNLEMLKGSRIRTNIGIIVNESMRTSRENVYAAGDVVEFKDAFLGIRRINATWPNAVLQGSVAAYNMLGIKRAYEGSDIVNTIDVFGIPLVVLGYLKSELRKPEQLVIKGRDHMKLLLSDNRIVGFQGMGDRALKYGGLIHTLMKTKADIDKLKPALKNGKLKNLFAGPDRT